MYVDPLLRVDVVAERPRDRDSLARRLADELVLSSCAVSAPAFMPVSAAVGKRGGVEDQLLPDLRSHRRRRRSPRSPRVASRLREPSAPSLPVVGEGADGGRPLRRGARPCRASTTVPLL